MVGDLPSGAFKPLLGDVVKNGELKTLVA